MTLIQRIKTAQVELRKAKHPLASLATTLIGEAEMVGKNAGHEVSDLEVVAMIKKFIKNLDETITILRAAKGDDSTQVWEKAWLVDWLPKQLTETELKHHVNEIHAGILGMQADCKMGDIMAVLKQRFEGQYDGKMASAVVKAQLA